MVSGQDSPPATLGSSWTSATTGCQDSQRSRCRKTAMRARASTTIASNLEESNVDPNLGSAVRCSSGDAPPATTSSISNPLLRRPEITRPLYRYPPVLRPVSPTVMKATRRRILSGQRVCAGCVGVGGLPDAHRKRVEPTAAERFCHLIPTVGGDCLGRSVDSLQAWDLVQIPVVHGAGQTLYSLPQFANVVERAVVSELLAAQDHLQPVGVSVRSGRRPEVPDEPMGGFEPRGDVDLIHPGLLGVPRR